MWQKYATAHRKSYSFGPNQPVVIWYNLELGIWKAKAIGVTAKGDGGYQTIEGLVQTMSIEDPKLWQYHALKAQKENL